MRTAELVLNIIREHSRYRSLESRVIRKSVKHGSELGRLEKCPLGNSLAAYPTSRPIP